jgi:hypothetical protein
MSGSSNQIVKTPAATLYYSSVEAKPNHCSSSAGVTLPQCKAQQASGYSVVTFPSSCPAFITVLLYAALHCAVQQLKVHACPKRVKSHTSACPHNTPNPKHHRDTSEHRLRTEHAIEHWQHCSTGCAVTSARHAPLPCLTHSFLEPHTAIHAIVPAHNQSCMPMYVHMRWLHILLPVLPPSLAQLLSWVSCGTKWHRLQQHRTAHFVHTLLDSDATAACLSWQQKVSLNSCV